MALAATIYIFLYGTLAMPLNFSLGPKITLSDTFTVYFRCLNKNLHESWFEYQHFNIQDHLFKTQIKIQRKKLFHVPGNSETICPTIAQRMEPTSHVSKLI